MTGRRVGSHSSEGCLASVGKIAMFCTMVVGTPLPGQNFCLTIEYMEIFPHNPPKALCEMLV
jgi:hypothetical protein